MISETNKKNAVPVSDDNMEENMEDILNSIRQIMNIEPPSSSSEKPPVVKKKAASFSDIPHISDKKKPLPENTQTVSDNVLVLQKPSQPPLKPSISVNMEKSSANKAFSLPDLIKESLHISIEKWVIKNVEPIVEKVVREEIKKCLICLNHSIVTRTNLV